MISFRTFVYTGLVLAGLNIGFVTPAHADCTSPAGVESQMLYDFSAGVLKICDGSKWKTGGMQSVTTAVRDAISSPPEGRMVYNTDNKRLEFYRGSGWYPVGATWVWGSAALPGGEEGLAPPATGEIVFFSWPVDTFTVQQVAIKRSSSIFYESVEFSLDGINFYGTTQINANSASTKNDNFTITNAGGTGTKYITRSYGGGPTALSSSLNGGPIKYMRFQRSNSVSAVYQGYYTITWSE